MKLAGRSLSLVNWDRCVSYAGYKASVLKKPFPFGATGAAFTKSFRQCASATGRGQWCRDAQLYCITQLWSPEFYTCVASGSPDCVASLCKAPAFLGE